MQQIGGSDIEVEGFISILRGCSCGEVHPWAKRQEVAEDEPLPYCPKCAKRSLPPEHRKI